MKNIIRLINKLDRNIIALLVWKSLISSTIPFISIIISGLIIDKITMEKEELYKFITIVAVFLITSLIFPPF